MPSLPFRADREQPLDAAPGDSIGPGNALAGGEPPPDEAAELDDELQRLLSGLDPEEQQVVDLKLQEHTNEEIAEKVGCSERTIRRVLARVQSRLRGMLEEGSAGGEGKSNVS